MKRTVLAFLLGLVCFCCFAKEYTYVDAYKLNLIGKPLEGTSNPYHRVDTLQYSGFSDYVNKLLRCSTGLAVLFKTDSRSIKVEYECGFVYDGVSTPVLSSMGFELYIKKDGVWTWAGCGASRKRGALDQVELVKNMAPGMKECLLYLPMYSEVLSCKVGVEEGSALESLESGFRNRICFYGSSFTQGVSTCGSSMSYPMQFMRSTGMQVLSMATSGNCLMQPEVETALHDVNADAFIFDTFSNPGKTIITARLKDFVDGMIAAHPGTPLIFQQSIWEPVRNFDVDADAWNIRKMATAEKILKEQILGKTGYEDVYFIQPNPYAKGYVNYADGIHPDDYGYYLWEKSIEKKVIRILRKYGIK